MGAADHAQRGAVAAGGEGAGVAVSEHACAGVEQAGAMIADGDAAGHLLPVQRSGRLLEVRDELLVGGPGRGIAHLLDRPGQVDGGRAGGGQAVAGLVKVVASSPGRDGVP